MIQGLVSIESRSIEIYVAKRHKHRKHHHLRDWQKHIYVALCEAFVDSPYALLKPTQHPAFLQHLNRYHLQFA